MADNTPISKMDDKEIVQFEMIVCDHIELEKINVPEGIKTMRRLYLENILEHVRNEKAWRIGFYAGTKDMIIDELSKLIKK